MKNNKQRGMCIICRKKRYREKLVPIFQMVTLFPVKEKKFSYNVCLVGCLDTIQQMELKNKIHIVRSERTN